MSRRTTVLTITLFSGCCGTAQAHPPYVEPWMHAMNLSVCGLVCAAVVVLLRRRLPGRFALAVGVLAFPCLALAGWLLSILASM